METRSMDVRDDKTQRVCLEHITQYQPVLAREKENTQQSTIYHK